MRRLLLFLLLILISLSVVQVASALDTPSIEVYLAYVAKDGVPTMIKVRY
ncbi:MAG: hypothetical protein QMC77_08865 [Methanocellales archaeon]|nr:hypothetical protein [Methanocellales archaeon]